MRRLVLALSAASLLACGDSSGPISNPVGTWNLSTINGSALPFRLDDQPGYRLEILRDVFVADADGTFTGATTFRETINGTPSTYDEPNNGTWSQTGNTVTVTPSDGTASSTATISGDKITLSEQGFVSVYRRQIECSFQIC